MAAGRGSAVAVHRRERGFGSIFTHFLRDGACVYTWPPLQGGGTKTGGGGPGSLGGAASCSVSSRSSVRQRIQFMRQYLVHTLSTCSRTSDSEVVSPGISGLFFCELLPGSSLFGVCVAGGVQEVDFLVMVSGKCCLILRLLDSGCTLPYSALLARPRIHALRQSTGLFYQISHFFHVKRDSDACFLRAPRIRQSLVGSPSPEEYKKN